MLSPDEWRDRYLIGRARNGDQRAFESLYRHHVRRVYGMLYRLSGNPTDAEDLTQETFLAAYQSLIQWRGEGRFSTYLCGIAYRKYNDSRRRPISEQLDETTEIPDLKSDPLQRFSNRERAIALDAAVKLLPDLCREVFVLVRIEERSYKEAATILEVPIGTVQSRLFRANRLLQQALAEWRPEDVPEVMNRPINPAPKSDFEKGVTPNALR